MLLAPLAAEVYRHQHERVLGSGQIAAGPVKLAHGVLDPAG
ncbi:hypothetical protein [Nocardia sp. NPDC046763]